MITQQQIDYSAKTLGLGGREAVKAMHVLCALDAEKVYELSDIIVVGLSGVNIEQAIHLCSWNMSHTQHVNAVRVWAQLRKAVVHQHVGQLAS